MMNVLKKIMILGGTKQMISVIESAKRVGISSIVVDNVIGAPAKQFADKAFNVNTADIARLSKIVQDEKVDGIFTAFDDMDTWHAIALCKKNDLPLYTADDHMPVPSYKEKFMEICSRFEVNVIEEYEVAARFGNSVSVAWAFPIVVEQVDPYAPAGLDAARSFEKKKRHSVVLDFPKYEKEILNSYIPILDSTQLAHIVHSGHNR